MFSRKYNEWKTWKTRYMRYLVIMVILYVFDEDLKITDSNYDIIEDTDLNTTIEKINNGNLFFYEYIIMIIEDQELIKMLSIYRT